MEISTQQMLLQLILCQQAKQYGAKLPVLQLKSKQFSMKLCLNRRKLPQTVFLAAVLKNLSEQFKYTSCYEIEPFISEIHIYTHTHTSVTLVNTIYGNPPCTFHFSNSKNLSLNSQRLILK